MKYIEKFLQSREWHEIKKILQTYFWKLLQLKYNEWKTGKKGGVIDIVDNRDYSFEEMGGGGNEIPATWDESYRLSAPQNQLDWEHEGGHVWCGPTSASMGADICGMENSKIWKDGKGIALFMKQKKRLFLFGTYLGDNPKYLKEAGLITGYYRISTVEQFKSVFSHGYPVLIGFKDLWNVNGSYERVNGSGHLVVGIPEYNEKGFYCLDPWKAKKVFMRWENLKYCFASKYALDTGMKGRKTDEMISLAKNYRKQRLSITQVYNKLKTYYDDNTLVLLAMRRAYGMSVDDKLKF